MDTAERRVVAGLWSLQGVGPKTIREIDERFDDKRALLTAPVASWAPGVTWRASAWEHVSRLQTLEQAAERLERRCRATRQQPIFPGDPQWPDRLDDVAEAPPVLFLRGPGAAVTRRRRLAFVGTRSPESGALEHVVGFAGEIAHAGVGVVSGAAIGVDQAAHAGALAARGETWALLGAGLDQIDEAQAGICAAILEAGGSLFSQYPPGQRANQSTFTRRNQVISGVSDAVLVFRAPAGSGALHTSDAAVKQGRPLLVVPGDPWNAAAQGSNALLRSGARACVSLDDVLEAVGLADSRSPAAGPVRPVDLSTLSELARCALKALGRASLDFEGVSAAVPGAPSGELSAALVELEIAGLIQQRGGRRYEKR